MNMKAMLGTVAALILAVAATAYLAVQRVRPRPIEVTTTEVVTNDRGEFSDNPFDLAASGPKSKAVVAESQFKFGEMKLGAVGTHDFIFKNEGEGPLKLAKGPLQCKCTMPAVPDGEVKPGESIAISLSWKPEQPSNEFKKEAIIWTNDPLNSRIILSIEGAVYPDPMAIPEEFVLGEVPWNRDIEAIANVASALADDLKIESSEVSHPEWMSVEYEIIPNSDLHKLSSPPPGPSPKSAWVVRLKVKPHAEVGTFTGWVKVKTNRGEEPLKLNVSGTRAGPISIHSEAYHASRTLIDLKRFKSAEGKSVKLFMFLEPFETDLKIESIKSASGNLTATLTKEGAAGKRDRYTLVVEAKTGINSGTTYTVDNPDTLTVTTNHPLVPSITFNARYIVQ